MGLVKKIVNVGDLKPMKNNVKKHPAWQIERLIHSITTYSNEEPKLLQPLVVDEKDMVLIGNGRLEAVKQLGWRKVEVIVKEGLSNDQKKALSILDNKSISTEWNEELLAQQLPELSDKALETGFTEKEIRDLMKKTSGSDIDIGTNEPMYELTPRLHEKYDYIMLFFDNEVDFLYVSQLLKLKKMRDRMKNNKVGLCRAIPGMDAVKLIQTEKKQAMEIKK